MVFADVTGALAPFAPLAWVFAGLSHVVITLLVLLCLHIALTFALDVERGEATLKGYGWFILSVAGILLGFVVVYVLARLLGWLYGGLPSILFGVPTLVVLLLVAIVVTLVFSSKRFFIVRRFGAMIVVTYLIATIVFFLAHASPYDPISQIMGERHTAQEEQSLRQEFGLDHGLWRQYTDYLGGLLHGDLGKSESKTAPGGLGAPVWSLLRDGVPVTLKLGAYALLLALLIGLPIGAISAIKQNSLVDHGSQSLMMILYAIPTFVLVPICQVIFGVELKWLPVFGWGDPGVQGFKELILPVTLYAAGLTAYFAKSYRSFMLEVLNQDYIRTARAKGLRQRIVIYRHAVKNTLLPLASIVGPTVAYLIVGAFIIEDFFGIPGIGLTTVQSVIESNYTVIEATTILLAVFVVLVNFFTDMFYAWVDPRVRL